MTHLGRDKTKNFNGKDKTAPSLFQHLLLRVEFRSENASQPGPPNLELTAHAVLLAKTLPVKVPSLTFSVLLHTQRWPQASSQ